MKAIALLLYSMLSAFSVLSLYSVNAQRKRCPLGMFCPIDAKANCTNATLCVVMCPTEKDLMQQGNHRTGKCEKVPEEADHWMDSTHYEVCIPTNQTLNVGIRDISLISTLQFRTNDHTYVDLSEDITFTLNGSCPYFYFTNMLKQTIKFENYYDYYIHDDVETVSLTVAKPPPPGDYEMQVIVTSEDNVIEKSDITVYVRDIPSCETSLDINECLTDNGGCDHICINTQYSFECLCNTSYILTADNRTCVPNVTKCNFILEEPSGSINTSGFPNTPYTSNSNCTWTIDLPAYKSIELKFDEMDIEESPNCVKDRVTILNGKDGDALPLGSYCGKKLPPTIQSSTEVITIKFVSDGTINNKGFNLNYRGLKERSKGVFWCYYISYQPTTFGLFTFPSKYYNSVSCLYHFLSSKQRIKITFLYLDIVNANCSQDRIEIFDGFIARVPTITICDGNKVVEYISKEAVLRMTYTGNSVGEYRGFHAVVTFL